MNLRDYQIGAVEESRALIEKGVKRILIHSGTGTGKTVIASEITKSAIGYGNRVTFLAHRRELVNQAWLKLRTFGVDAGVTMGTDPRRASWKPVCVASVQTLVRREYKPPTDLLIIDECHHATAETYQKIIDCYPEAVILGLTATPRRENGRGLGDIFQAMVSCPSVADMMRRVDPATGSPYLVGTRVFAPPSVDLKGVHIVRGEYKSDELAQVCDKRKLIGDMVKHWKRHAAGQRTIAFGVSVDHSKHIVEMFSEEGIPAEHLDGTTPTEDRDAILGRLKSGKTLLVSNCAVLTEGFDEPAVSCIILACPTKSLTKYLQMIGRALRPYPSKEFCLVLDHAAAVHEHGFVDDEREWSLDQTPQKIVTEKLPTIVTCKQSVMDCWCGHKENHEENGVHWPCYATFKAGPERCPYCFCPIVKKARKIQTVDGDLEELRRQPVQTVIAEARDLFAKPPAPREATAGTPTSRRAQLEFLLKKAQAEGKKPGWAKAVAEAKWGGIRVPPEWMPPEWRKENGF